MAIDVQRTAHVLMSDGRTIAAAEDTVSIDAAVKDIEKERRHLARYDLLTGKTVRINAAIGGMQIRIKIMPICPPSRPSKEKV